MIEEPETAGDTDIGTDTDLVFTNEGEVTEQEESVSYEQVRDQVISDYKIANFSEISQGVKEKLVEEISRLISRINAADSQLDDKKKLFEQEIALLGGNSALASQISFFSEQISFSDTDSQNPIADQQAVLAVMTLDVGKAKINEGGGNLLHVFLVTDEINLNDQTSGGEEVSDFIKKRFEKGAEQQIVERLRQSFYENLEDGIEVKYLFGSLPEADSQ